MVSSLLTTKEPTAQPLLTEAQVSILTKRLNKSEGRKRFPYRDTVGKLTIGVGFNLDDVGLYDEEIDFILQNRVRLAAVDAAKLPVYAKLDPIRQTVLVDMVFNMGLDTVKKFRNTLAYMEQGDYAAAARGMRNSLWARQVGKRAEELAKIMETGSLEAGKIEGNV